MQKSGGTFVCTGWLDSTGGDSGGPVYRGTWRAVGIHTHGGCSVSGGSNAGTNKSLPAFQSALQTVL